MTPPPSLQDLIETVHRDAPSDGSLDQLVTAARTVGQLEDTGDALLGHFVTGCRRDGRSWSEISSALGVTKQAVHKRFSGAIAGQLIAAGQPTFERLTPRARSTLAAAAGAAGTLGADRIGTAHLLLGLYAEPAGIAARVLAEMNVERADVADAIRAAAQSAVAADIAPGPGTGPAGPDSPAEMMSPPADDQAAPGGATRLPLSAAASRALHDSVAGALELGHNYIGTEHILLGLYRSPQSLAATILGSLGAPAEEVTVRVSETLSSLTRP
ncbi:MAG TPA: Clp protease N-terminal domain-containing protein [Streptosporangiaceae bacterium]|jgi:ATP-dependent Clp protease ATP-binding subunit ClpA